MYGIFFISLRKPHMMICVTHFEVYFYLCVVFIAFNFSGFLLEVWGGLRAARSTSTAQRVQIFADI